MEFTTPSAGDMAVFRELREDLEIGLGCVDVTPGKIDSAETIAGRVRQALKHLAPERITLNPDCGFAPGSGAVVSIDEAYRKLCEKQNERVKDVYRTMGRYDVAAVVDAPDDVTMSALVYSLAALGNIHTETHRAFTAQETEAALGRVA